MSIRNPDRLKRCGRCKRFKPRTEFSPDSTTYDHVHWCCRLCEAAVAEFKAGKLDDEPSAEQRAEAERRAVAIRAFKEAKGAGPGTAAEHERFSALEAGDHDRRASGRGGVERIACGGGCRVFRRRGNGGD